MVVKEQGEGYFRKGVLERILWGGKLEKNLNEVNEHGFSKYEGNGNNKCKYTEFRKQWWEH